MVFYVKTAYDKMVQQWQTDKNTVIKGKKPWANKPPPTMMSVFWIPAFGDLIIGSSTRGGPVPEVGYDASAIAPQVVTLLEAAAKAKKFPKDHKNQGTCAEILAISEAYKRYPDKPATQYAPSGAQMIAYGAPGQSAPQVHNPCSSTENELGCKTFLEWWKLRYVSKAEVSAATGGKVKRVAGSEIELVERDSGSDNELVEYQPVDSQSSDGPISGTPVKTFTLDPEALSGGPSPSFSIATTTINNSTVPAGATGIIASGSGPSGTPALAPRFVNHIISPTLSTMPTPVATD